MNELLTQGKELHIRIKNAKYQSREMKKLTQEEWESLLSYLRDKNIPSKDKKLNNNTYCNRNVVGRYWTLTNNDHVETIDSIDRDIVNGALKDMRSGGEGYVYYLRYVELLLKYEPDMQVRYEDGVFWCWLD